MVLSASSSKSRSPAANKLKRTLHSLANSTDTEQYETPPRKRFRRDDSVSLTSSASSSRNSVKRRNSARFASKSEPKRVSRLNVPSVLRRCEKNAEDYNAMDELKCGLPRDRTSLYLIQPILDSAKVSTKRRADRAGKPLLETELYLDWLKGIFYAVSAVENMLAAKIQGTRRRIPGLGRPVFSILYTLLDEYISEVALHHDGGSFRSTSYPGLVSPYPLTMTLVEEARDPSTDERSEEVRKEVEELLRKYDDVMLDALTRYKAESAKSKRIARSIGRKEQSLAKALCWLCEQTGFGSEESDTGDSLLHRTKEAMQDWKHQYAANDDDGASDDDW